MTPTPRDDPSLLPEWRLLDRELQEQGMGRYQARREIASRYETSVSTVYRWLENKPTPKPDPESGLWLVTRERF
ncbi:MAG: hypothetical protein HYT72_00420 [Candidatus Aenigmarchaeota archaeon]|nr:hypothetical protein [Candidatus Aenigmarchaeota archaeon]